MSSILKENPTNPPLQKLDAEFPPHVVEIGGRVIEILDIRNRAHRIRAAEILASDRVIPWLRTTPGLIGNARSQEVALTIQRVKGQSGEALRGNVMSITVADIPHIVDTKRHHWSIRWFLEHRPRSLVAPRGGIFWNVYPRQKLAQKYPWLTKPQVTGGEPTVVINVHNDPLMGALFNEVRRIKEDFAIQGTSAQPHGQKQITRIEEIDPSFFDDPKVALVILDASHIDENTLIAETAAAFPIFDLTGANAGGKEFATMRKGGYAMPLHMQRLLDVLRVKKEIMRRALPHRRGVVY